MTLGNSWWSIPRQRNLNQAENFDKEMFSSFFETILQQKDGKEENQGKIGWKLEEYQTLVDLMISFT